MHCGRQPVNGRVCVTLFYVSSLSPTQTLSAKEGSYKRVFGIPQTGPSCMEKGHVLLVPGHELELSVSKGVCYRYRESKKSIN